MASRRVRLLVAALVAALAHGRAVVRESRRPARDVAVVRQHRPSSSWPGKEWARKALQPNAVRHLLSGAVAGAVSNTAVAPLDIMRLNLICADTPTSARAMARAIYARGGILAFWHGNTADVIRTIPSSAIRFYTFATYKQKLGLVLLGAPAMVSLLAGGFAGMTAMGACFPLEAVRTRMATLGAAQGVNIVSYTRQLVAAEGVGTLYKGLVPSLISVMPYFAVRFGTYDILMRWHAALSASSIGSALDRLPGIGPPLNGFFGEPGSASVVAFCGMSAGLCASATTFPFEVVRRRAMVGACENNPFTAISRIVRTEGITGGLYKGFGLNMVKVNTDRNPVLHRHAPSPPFPSPRSSPHRRSPS